MVDCCGGKKKKKKKNRTKVQVWGSQRKEYVSTPLHLPLLHEPLLSEKLQQSCWCLNSREGFRVQTMTSVPICLSSSSPLYFTTRPGQHCLMSPSARSLGLVDKRRQRRDWFQRCETHNPLHWSHLPHSHGLSHTKHATQTYRTLQSRVHPSATYHTTDYSTCYLRLRFPAFH